MSEIIRIGVLGASGYTGADLIRLASGHEHMEIRLLTASSHAGKPMSEVFPHLSFSDVPDLVTIDDADWSAVDAVFCGLPHGTTQGIASRILGDHPDLRFIDMSADFRLTDPAVYEEWYGHPHLALDLQNEAVYGLTEHHRDDIRGARIVACPGCYPTAVLLALIPTIAAGSINAHDIIIDAKSGVTGAGRGLKQKSLFPEAGEGLSPYAIGTHRHSAEIEQELGLAAGNAIVVNFTPHLVPMSRGELCTIYVRLAENMTADKLRDLLADAYSDEPFIHVTPEGIVPQTQNVRGSNHVQIGVFADRVPGRAIIVSTLDNLVKGSAGQAVQNFNLMFGMPETEGLKQLPLFP